MKTQLITLTLIIISSLTVQAQDTVKTFGTITEALNYDGDRSEIKHLIITDSISGSDFSEGSEWREFRTLNLAYPALSEITIHTDQDIPSVQQMMENGMYNTHTLFFFTSMNEEEEFVDWLLSPWLKGFYAPNTTKLGGAAFMECKNLLSVDFSSVKTIETYAFAFCQSLISISLPVVQKFYDYVFIGCKSLAFVSIGTGFTEPITIEYGWAVFDCILYPHPFIRVKTENIDLTLSEYVISPVPDLQTNIWMEDSGFGYGSGRNYVWKSITVCVDIEEKDEKKINIFCIDKNIYYVNSDIFDLELFDINGRLVKSYNNETVIDLNNIATGIYFLKYFDNRKKLKTEKIIVN